MGIDSLLEPASSGLSKNCSFWPIHIGFTVQPLRLPFGCWPLTLLTAPTVDKLLTFGGNQRVEVMFFESRVARQWNKHAYAARPAFKTLNKDIKMTTHTEVAQDHYIFTLLTVVSCSTKALNVEAALSRRLHAVSRCRHMCDGPNQSCFGRWN